MIVGVRCLLTAHMVETGHEQLLAGQHCDDRCPVVIPVPRGKPAPQEIMTIGKNETC